MQSEQYRIGGKTMTEEEIRAFLQEYTKICGDHEKARRDGNKIKATEYFGMLEGMQKMLEILGNTKEIQQFYANMCQWR
jgi:hypothetical protein